MKSALIFCLGLLACAAIGARPAGTIRAGPAGAVGTWVSLDHATEDSVYYQAHWGIPQVGPDQLQVSHFEVQLLSDGDTIASAQTAQVTATVAAPRPPPGDSIRLSLRVRAIDISGRAGGWAVAGPWTLYHPVLPPGIPTGLGVDTVAADGMISLSWATDTIAKFAIDSIQVGADPNWSWVHVDSTIITGPTVIAAGDRVAPCRLYFFGAGLALGESQQDLAYCDRIARRILDAWNIRDGLDASAAAQRAA